MPQFIEGPPITREAINLGVPSRSPGGGTEIHYDSSAMRSAYEAGNNGGAPMSPPAAAVMGPMPGMAGPNVELPVDMGDLDPEILKALTGGQPPPLNKMPPVGSPVGRGPAPNASSIYQPTQPTQQYTTMLLPLGGGVTAQVVFIGKVPKARHWQRLIKHMQIEAVEVEADHAEAEREATDAAEARELLARALNDLGAQQRAASRNDGSGLDRPVRSEPELSRPLKRRVRKNERGTPEPPELAGDPESSAGSSSEDSGIEE